VDWAPKKRTNDIMFFVVVSERAKEKEHLTKNMAILYGQIVPPRGSFLIFFFLFQSNN